MNKITYFLAIGLIPPFIPLGYAGAQQPGATRFELGPVARVEKVWIEGGATGSIPVAGVVAAARLSNSFGVEADLTSTKGAIGRSYEGGFFSFPESPNPTREEIERRAVIARRSLEYIPGIGGSVAFTARHAVASRATLTALAGLAYRRYVETSTFSVLKIPEGVDPAVAVQNFADSRSIRGRGGLLLGFQVPITVANRIKVAPELRYVYGGPAYLRHKYRALNVGLRAGWNW